MIAIDARGRRTEGQVVLAVERAAIVTELAVAPGILDARLDHAPLAGIHRGASTGLLAAVFGPDVEHAAGGVAEPCRKDTVDEIEAIDEQRIDHRNEGWVGVDVERNLNPVDLVLEP